MKIRDYLLYAASMVGLANECFDVKLNKSFNQISNTRYKGSSTKVEIILKQLKQEEKRIKIRKHIENERLSV